MLCHILLTSMVSDENPLSFGGFELVFPYRSCVVSLWLLSKIWWVFGFQKFNYDVPWHGFLWVYSVCSASWVCRFVSLATFEAFSATISLDNLSASLSSSFILGLWWCERWIFCYYPPHPGGCAHSFFYFLSIVLTGWNLFICPQVHWFYPLSSSL